MLPNIREECSCRWFELNENPKYKLNEGESETTIGIRIRKMSSVSDEKGIFVISNDIIE